jgi:acylpyruvate hydrolase
VKLALYSTISPDRVRLGVVLSGELVGDLQAGYADHLGGASTPRARELAGRLLPHDMVRFLGLGQPGWDAARAAVDHLEALSAAEPSGVGRLDQPLFTPLAACRLHAPLRPSKMIAVGRNYASHVTAAGAQVTHGGVPSAWIKANSAITGPTSDIVRPSCTQELDYETELAVVISQKCKNVPEDQAHSVIAGYVIVNDISARDIARLERRAGNHLLDKMFDTFAPMGPWLVTKDEIEDPMNLEITTRVNGDLRQNANTREMIWSIPKLISFLSQMTLEPGDVIMTGTPEGTAMERKPESFAAFLQPHDILESQIESIGTLRNRITEEAPTEGSWAW